MKIKRDYAALIQEYELGGLKQREFCSRSKIKYPTFQYWLSRVRKQEANRSRFLPVRVIDEKSPVVSSLPVEICYPDGTVLKLSQATAEFVKQFLPQFTS